MGKEYGAGWCGDRWKREKMAEGRNRSAVSVQANVQHCSANIAQ